MKKKFPKLERYNQILWATIGSGVVIVIALVLLGVMISAVYSWLHPDRGGVPVAVIDDDGDGKEKPKTIQYDFCQPVAVYGAPYQLIRVVSNRFAVHHKSMRLEKKMRGNSYGSSEAPYYDRSCGIRGSDEPSATVNVLVRHIDNNSLRLLLPENAVVQTIDQPQPPADRHSLEDSAAFPPPGIIYWEIATDDSNGDNIIDDRDDLGAYLSDADGRTLTRITPKPSRVLEKTYDKKRNLLTLLIVRDTNDDKILDDKDKTSLIEVGIAERRQTREILNATTLTNLMQQAEPRRQVK